MAPTSPDDAALARTRVEVLVLDLDRLGGEREVLCGALDPDDVARWRSHADPLAAERWARRRGALRIVLARATGRPPAALRFARGPWGKPRLATDPDLEFGVSGSGPWAAVALAHGAAVGVDLERLRSVPERDAIARDHLGPAIAAHLATLAPERAEREFLRRWTRHEAERKRTGVGLVGDAPRPRPRDVAAPPSCAEFLVEDGALLAVAVAPPRPTAPMTHVPPPLAGAVLCLRRVSEPASPRGN